MARMAQVIITDDIRGGAGLAGEICIRESDNKYVFIPCEGVQFGELTAKFIYKKLKELNNANI